MLKAKYEVFISSADKHIEPIRRAIIEATSEMGYIPTIEQSRERAEVSEDIMRSDIFVLIVGAEFELDLNRESFIAFEHERAKEFKKPIIYLLLKKERAEKLLDGLSNEKKFYKKFMSSLDTDSSIIIFDFTNNMDKIKSEYVKKLENATKKLNGKVGWFRVNSELMAKIIDRFVNNTKLMDRTIENSDLKETIAHFFIKYYLPILITNGCLKFFFESGSSTAFLAKEFVDSYETKSIDVWGKINPGEVQIKTNNSLAHSYFFWGQNLGTLCMYPPGNPNNEYGATLGILEDVNGPLPSSKENVGTFRGSEMELNAINGFAKEFNNDYVSVGSEIEHKGIIFMAASGVEIDEGKDEGPHVHSYRNMLFKKALLASKCPTVMFLDGTKLPKKKENRYLVCDNNLSWRGICSIESPKPFAIAIGLRADAVKEKEIREIFKELKLYVKAEDYIGDICVLVAENVSFTSILKPKTPPKV